MSYNILTFELLDVEVIDPWSVLDRHKKEALLLSITNAQKRPIIALKRILALVCIIIKTWFFFWFG